MAVVSFGPGGCGTPRWRGVRGRSLRRATGRPIVRRSYRAAVPPPRRARAVPGARGRLRARIERGLGTDPVLVKRRRSAPQCAHAELSRVLPDRRRRRALRRPLDAAHPARADARAAAASTTSIAASGKMSRTLLIGRLRELERRGIVERTVDDAGRTTEYRLTTAGRELEPIVWALGHWAARWSFGDPADEELDVGWLVWRLHQHVAMTACRRGGRSSSSSLDGPERRRGLARARPRREHRLPDRPGLRGGPRRHRRQPRAPPLAAGLALAAGPAARRRDPPDRPVAAGPRVPGWFGPPPFARSLGRGTPQALAG